MTYKNLLVHVDDGKTCAARLAVATGLAGTFDAHLAGVAVDPGIVLPVMADVPVSPALVDRLEADRAERVASAESLFRAACASAGREGEWRLAQGELVDRLTLHARHADLLVVGQEGDESESVVIGGLPDSLVMTCGRPVLVVPYIGAADSLGRRVLVAWDGGREAVRALNDALPLLVRAERVEVVSINPSDLPSEDGGHIPGADICLHLARHGVTAEAQHVMARDIDVGNLLLSRVADTGSDLLVMGAYGHSRWREIVLGGATKQVLGEMTVPVLMSH